MNGSITFEMLPIKVVTSLMKLKWMMKNWMVQI